MSVDKKSLDPVCTASVKVKMASEIERIASVLESTGQTRCADSARKLANRVRVAAEYEIANDKSDTGGGIDSESIEDTKAGKSMVEEGVMSKKASELMIISRDLDNAGYFKEASLVLDLAGKLKVTLVPDTSSDMDGCPECSNTLPDTNILEIPGTIVNTPDLLGSLQTLEDARIFAEKMGKGDVVSKLASLIERVSAREVASQPYMIKTLEEKFEGLDMGDPDKVIKDFETSVEKLEKALEAALQKVKEHKSSHFKLMIDNSFKAIQAKPQKAEELNRTLIKGIVAYIRNLDARIKNTFSEYNR